MRAQLAGATPLKLGLTTTSRSIPRPQAEVAAGEMTPSTERPLVRADQEPARDDVLVSTPATSPLSLPVKDDAPESAGLLESTTKLIRRETLTGTGRHTKGPLLPPAAPSSMPIAAPKSEPRSEPKSQKAPPSSRGADNKPPSERRRRPRK